MEIVENLRNTQVYPKNDVELTALRADKWAVYKIAPPTHLAVNTQVFRFREGLTFTPFANPVPCNAHCRFCSEELQKKENHQLTAQRYIKDYDQYFEGLEKALIAVKSLRIGLSLSGLEATAEPAWLLRLLGLFFQINPIFQFDEKVLYTNGSGLFKHEGLINALKNSHFDRIELSRCHPQQDINQSIMYFNKNEPVWQNMHYENLVKNLHGQLFVKNSCILTQKGTKNIEDIENYLHWAIDLGIKEAVFRELSRLDNSYTENKTAKWVAENRVLIEPILQEIAPKYTQARKNWQYLYSTIGYYYYNEHYRYNDQIEVIIETSSYPALENANETGTIQKMVFHSNGNLCGGWNPDTNVIANFF